MVSFYGREGEFLWEMVVWEYDNCVNLCCSVGFKCVCCVGFVWVVVVLSIV